MRDLIRGVSWLGAANLAVKPVWFLFITALCVRILGVEVYGEFTAAIAFALMAVAFTDLGMSRLTTREVARDRIQGLVYVSSFIVVRLTGLGLAAILALIVGYYLGYRGSSLESIALALAYASGFQMTQYCRSVLEAYEQLTREARLLVFEKVLVVGLGSAGLLYYRSPQGVLAGMAVGMVIGTVAHLRGAATLAGARHEAASWSFLKSAVPRMVPLGIGGLFLALYYRVDLVMVERMLDTAAAGRYGLAYRVLEAMNMVIALVVIAGLYPRLSRLMSERRYEAYSKLLWTGLGGLAVVGCLMAAAVTALAPLVIEALAPDVSFQPAVGALRILVWAFPLLALNGLLYSALLTLDDERATAWFLMVAVIMNVALNLWLIPRLGINGAAIATIIPECMLVVVYSLRYHIVRRRAFQIGGS